MDRKGLLLSIVLTFLVDLKLIREHASKNRFKKFQDPLAGLAKKLGDHSAQSLNVRGKDHPKDQDIFGSTRTKRRSSTLFLTANPSPFDQIAPVAVLMPSIAAADVNPASTIASMLSSPIQPLAPLSTNSEASSFPSHPPTGDVFNLVSQPNSDPLTQQAPLPATSDIAVPMKVRRPTKKHLARDLVNLQTWSRFQVQVPPHGSRTKMQWITTFHGDKMKARVRRSERLKLSDRLITYKF